MDHRCSPRWPLTDEVAALVGAFATLVALRHAEGTGRGQVVDVNLLESMFQIMGPLVSAYAHLGYLQPLLGSGIPYTVPARDVSMRRRYVGRDLEFHRHDCPTGARPHRVR